MKDERFKNYNATVRFIKNIVPLFDLLNSKGNMQVGFKSTFWKIFKNKCYRNTPVLLDIDNIKSYTWQKDLQHRLQHSSCSMRTIVKKSKTIIYPFHYVSSLWPVSMTFCFNLFFEVIKSWTCGSFITPCRRKSIFLWKVNVLFFFKFPGSIFNYCFFTLFS